MRFAQGSTRWVILTDRYAIKIARVRPLRPFVKLVELFREKKSVARQLAIHDENALRAAIKYVAAGIVANLYEYRRYRDTKSPMLAPTVSSFMGIINVQVRGQPVSEEVREHFWKKAVAGTPAEEDMYPDQFCRIGDAIVLADYGRPDLQDIFKGLLT